MQANGSFDVKMGQLEFEGKPEGSMLGRMSIDKQFHGPLEAASKGQMLSSGTAVKGSAGYVAIEHVTGTLNGLKGSFTLQHSGTMARGEPSLTLTVIPDSGTGELTGLKGKMAIKFDGPKHLYEFEYTLEP
jgi:Protein of unknown function (DUF3224)